MKTGVSAIREVFPGVFQLDDFIHPAVGKLLAQLAAEQAEKADHGPNSMNKYGAVLIGSLRDICRHIAFPAMQRAFPQIELSRTLYAMTVSYDVKKQRSLAAHEDSSDFTFNGCLVGKFTGGELVVYSAKNMRERKVLKQKPGRVFIHRGDVVHRAMPLKSGHRTNVVLWCTEKKRAKGLER